MALSTTPGVQECERVEQRRRRVRLDVVCNATKLGIGRTVRRKRYLGVDVGKTEVVPIGGRLGAESCNVVLTAIEVVVEGGEE
jgi:hypothetical protein